MRRTIAVLAALVPVAIWAAPEAPRYRVVEAFPSLSFRRPVDLQTPRDGTNRLFVVEQDGVIRVLRSRPDVRTASEFLDVRDRVNTNGNEMGLLGLAFHPDYARNRVFFVYYTASKWTRRISRLSRFRASAANADAADAKSEEVVLEVEQPWSNHNGGQITFGPDGYLYVGLGDGGSAGDPEGNGQNRAALLGKILRIDVSRKEYRIPPDNPFAANTRGWKEEIYAYGLRNPWRFSFDPPTGRLWAADVGQVTWEEIDLIEKGKNYGWDCREGAHPYEPAGERSTACRDGGDFTDPVWAYGRSEGMSVTGGYVYRGAALPDLVGWYVYADYVTGRIWALRYEAGRATNRLLVDTDLLISSFGLDESNELYICSHDPSNGETKIYKLVAE